MSNQLLPPSIPPRADSAVTLVDDEQLRQFWLVTGGAGFIGSHLVESLLERGDKVRVLDDISTGKVENLPKHPNLQLVQGDVADPEIVRQCLVNVDGVFHLAAVASVQKANEEWLSTHRTNLTATVTILDEIRRKATIESSNPIPFVYASSAAVYGSCPDIPLTESSVPRPLSAYGADKLSCELQAYAAGHVHKIPTCGFRFFNVYGPRQDPKSPYSGVISIFADRMVQGLPITIFGDGQQTRDFIHVKDIVSALIQGMRNGCSTQGPVYNVCTGTPITLNTLVQHLSELLHYNAKPNYGPDRPGDIRHSVGDPTSTYTNLDWKATVSMDTGLTSLKRRF